MKAKNKYCCDCCGEIIQPGIGFTVHDGKIIRLDHEPEWLSREESKERK
jgi:hypothetical protein